MSLAETHPLAHVPRGTKKRDVHAERASQKPWGGWFLGDKDGGREAAVGIG